MIFDGKKLHHAENAYKQAYRSYAYTFRICDGLIEEMAELTQAIVKLRRGKPNALENLREEFFDVMACMEFLGRALGITQEDLQEHIGNKGAERLFERLTTRKFDGEENLYKWIR